MTQLAFPDLTLALPEIFLAAAAMVLLMLRPTVGYFLLIGWRAQKPDQGSFSLIGRDGKLPLQR